MDESMSHQDNFIKNSVDIMKYDHNSMAWEKLHYGIMTKSNYQVNIHHRLSSENKMTTTTNDKLAVSTNKGYALV